MHLDVHEWIWLTVCIMKDAIELYPDCNVIDLDLDINSRSQEC